LAFIKGIEIEHFPQRAEKMSKDQFKRNLLSVKITEKSSKSGTLDFLFFIAH
jgi:hypothetical protein